MMNDARFRGLAVFLVMLVGSAVWSSAASAQIDDLETIDDLDDLLMEDPAGAARDGVIGRPLALADMRRLAQAAVVLAESTETKLVSYRSTLNGWADTAYLRDAFVEYIPPALRESFRGRDVRAIDFVRGYIDLISIQKHDIAAIAAKYDPAHAPVLDEDGRDERLSLREQTERLWEIRAFVDLCVYSRLETLDLVVDGMLDQAYEPLGRAQRSQLDGWRGEYDEEIASREEGGQSLSEREKIELALTSRAAFADREKAAFTQFAQGVEQTLTFLQQEYDAFGGDLSRWIAGCPRELPPMRHGLVETDTFFTAANAIVRGTALPESEGLQPLAPDIGNTWGISTGTYFFVPEAAETERASTFVDDYHDLFRVFVFDVDDRRRDDILGSVNWTSKVVFPNLMIPKHRAVAPAQPDITDVERRRSPYPDVILARMPTIEGVRLFGKGLPSRETNDWSWLVPRELCEQHQLHGRWIVMVVHGRALFDLEGRAPEVMWAPADRHLKYVLLGASKFNEDQQWAALWRELGVDERTWRGQDCYILGVQLGAQTWAGDYAVRLGDLTVEWTLPFSTNVATARFVQEVTPPRQEFEPVQYAFPGGTVYVEIRTTADVPTTDRIPFQLIRADANGGPSLVHFGWKLEDTILYAVRTDDPRVFRSKAITFNVSGGSNAQRKVMGVTPNERIAARILPHSVARQDEHVPLLRIAENPAAVGGSWEAAVRNAARIAGIRPAKPWNRMSREDLNEFVRTPWATVSSTTVVRIGGRDIRLAVGDLAAMLLIRDEFIRQMEGSLPNLQKLRDDAARDADATSSARALLRQDAEPDGSPLGDLEVRYRRPREFITDRFAPFRRVYDDAWLERTFGGIRGDVVAFQNEATLDVLTRYAAAAEQTLLDAKGVSGADPEKLLRLTAIGMRPVAQRLYPLLQRQVRAGDDAVWEVDRVARSYLGTIQQLGAEFIANEALMDQYNARLALVAAGVSMLSPATVVERAIVASVSVASMTATMTVEFPEYFARKNDVQFAIGAYSAIGPERYAVASMREKPGWQMFLEFAGGSLDCAIALGQLATGGMNLRVLTDAEIADALGDARVMSSLNRPARRYLTARVIELGKARAAGEALERVQDMILQRAMSILDDAGIRPAMEAPVVLVRERAAANATEAAVSNAGDVLVTTVRFRNEIPEVLVLTEHGQLGSLVQTVRTVTVRDMGGVFDSGIAVERFYLLENQPWQNYLVGERLGEGAFFAVYDLTDQAGRVLKVSRDLEESAALIQRIRHCANLMGEEIPQLAIHEARVVDGVATVVQSRIPAEGAYMLERVQGFAHLGPRTGTVVDETATVVTARGVGPLRVVGVKRAGADAVVAMSSHETRAVCQLYRNFIEKGLIWYDGHLGNIVFTGEGESLIAKVLDQDFIWKWDESFWGGPVGRSMGATLESVYRLDHKVMRNRLQSMIGARLPDRAEWMLNAGQHLYPDAEYFMLKMLEFHGYINYIPGRGFTDGAMKLTDVIEHMPSLRRRMNELIDPDLNQLVKPRIRRGSFIPAGLDPAAPRMHARRLRIAA